MRKLTVILIGVLAVLLIYRALREEPASPQSRLGTDQGIASTRANSQNAAAEHSHPELPPPSTASTPASMSYATPMPIQAEHTLDLNIIGPASVKLGDIFSVSVNGEVQTGVSRYRFEIRYDPGQLASIAATGGNFMEQGSAYAHLSENAAANSGNVAIEVEQDGGGGVEGAGNFAVIQFRALTPGVAVVRVDKIEANESNGRTIRASPAEPLSVRINS